ncbi:hypothetical protein GCM10027569_17330 [Flindersiella endophytica]
MWRATPVHVRRAATPGVFFEIHYGTGDEPSQLIDAGEWLGVAQLNALSAQERLDAGELTEAAWKTPPPRCSMRWTPDPVDAAGSLRIIEEVRSRPRRRQDHSASRSTAA